MELNDFLDHMCRFPPTGDSPFVYESLTIPVWPDGSPKDNRIVGWTVHSVNFIPGHKDRRCTLRIRTNSGEVAELEMAELRFVMDYRHRTKLVEEVTPENE